MRGSGGPWLALLLVAGLLVPQTFAQDSGFMVLDSYWGSPGNPVEVVAGDINAQLVLSMGYTGEAQIANPRLTLILPTGFRNSTGGTTVTSMHPLSVSYGGKVDFTFKVSVDSDARDGIHTCSGIIEWATYGLYYNHTIKQWVSKISGTWSENLTIPIVLHARPNLEMTFSPNTIVAGRSNNVTLFISNVGDVDIRNLELTISTSSGLALLGADNKFFVQEIGPGQRAQLDLTLLGSTTLVGAMAQMTLGISFKTSYGFSKSETRVITIPVRGYSEAQVVSVAVPPSSTSRFMVSGTIANTGTITLRAATISVEPSPQFSPVSPAFVGDISVGAQAPYTLQMTATEVGNGTYPLTLVVSYRDDFGVSNVVRQTANVEIVVKAPSTSQQPPSGIGSLLDEIKPLQIAVSLLIGVGVGYLVFRKKEAAE